MSRRFASSDIALHSWTTVKNIQLDLRDLNIGPENKFQKFWTKNTACLSYEIN